MEKDLEKLYEIYKQVKIKSPVHVGRVQKGDTVTIKFMDGEFLAEALYGSSLNGYNKEMSIFAQKGCVGSIWAAEWNGENWIADPDHQFH